MYERIEEMFLAKGVFGSEALRLRMKWWFQFRECPMRRPLLYIPYLMTDQMMEKMLLKCICYTIVRGRLWLVTMR